MRIVILDGYLVSHGDISWEEIAALGSLTVYDNTVGTEQTITRLKDADAVFLNRCAMTEEIFQSCRNLKFVGVFGTGFNVVDIASAKKHGVTVCNIPAYSTYAVAQATISLLLAITNKAAYYDRYIKETGWHSATDPAIVGVQTTELFGKTMGIIGMGDIGYQVAQIAAALGMKVLGYRRHPKKELETAQIRFTDLDTLLQSSDIISIHCPLNEESRGLIDNAALAKMKDGTILLNTARGAVLNEQAVADALDSGKLLYAGLDVLTHEPPQKENPLPSHPKVILTPHVAWSPKETRIRCIHMCAENLAAFLSGSPIHVVNP